MKNLILTIVLTTAYFCSFGILIDSKGSDINSINYVVSNDNVQYFKKMRKGLNSTIIARTFEGEKVVYKLDNVESYRINGKEYQRKYLVNTHTQTVEKVFLQRIYTAAGYSLFKKVKGANERFKLSDLYVYKGDIQMHQLDKENYKIILSFFFPKFNQMFSK
jgi:transcription elongation factor